MTQPTPPPEERLRAQEDRYIQEAKTVEERLTRAKVVEEARRERAKQASPINLLRQNN